MRKTVAVLWLIQACMLTPVHAQSDHEAAEETCSTVLRSDRFPGIQTGTSPILAIATVTFARVRPSAKPEWLQQIMEAVHGAPGLLGAHTAASFEQPGMVLIFTWWRDKQALNHFFYSDTHQGWMRAGARNMKPAETVHFEAVPTQVGIELFTALPGGTVGGGLAPRGVKAR